MIFDIDQLARSVKRKHSLESHIVLGDSGFFITKDGILGVATKIGDIVSLSWWDEVFQKAAPFGMPAGGTNFPYWHGAKWERQLVQKAFLGERFEP
jgi:hypothetical protein